jgi:hypothetical protein
MRSTSQLIGCALRVAALAILVNGLAGCDGSEHPDTGYGGGQTVPATINCSDLCTRSADCAGHLCAEDKNDNGYLGKIGETTSMCLFECTDSVLQSKATSTQWSCLFDRTCREVFGHDACGVVASYKCY